MQDVTDLAFMQVIASYGPPDFFFTEFFRVHAQSRPEKHILRSITENTTGRPVAEPADIRTALARQVVSPVLWEDCMRNVAAAGAAQFWELGPGGVLAGLARRTNQDWPVQSFAEFADLAA